MPFMTPARAGSPPADETVPFDVTLTAPAIEQPLFTVPAGKYLRGVTFLCEGPGDARISLVADATPAPTDLLLKQGEAGGLDALGLPAGAYKFVNATLTKKPRVRGIAQVGP